MKRIFSALLIFLLSLCGCDVTINGSSYHYDDFESYTAGGASLSEPIDALSIHWVSGSVRVEYGDSDCVTVSETGNRTLNDLSSLYYRVKEGRLTIQFAKSGEINLGHLKKDLTVTLPRDSSLTSLTLDTVSANTVLSTISVDAMEVKTVSGDLTFDGGQVRTLKIHSVSGDFDLVLPCTLDLLEMNTVSGKMTAKADGVARFDVNSVSANISLTAKNAPDKTACSSTSGDLTLNLPADIGMTVRFDSVSGKIRSDLEMRKEYDAYIIGDGEAECELRGISADLRINATVIEEGGVL